VAYIFLSDLRLELANVDEVGDFSCSKIVGLYGHLHLLGKEMREPLFDCLFIEVWK
jgi:hypothetical protein